MRLFYYHNCMSLNDLFQNKAYVIPSHMASENGDIELVKFLLNSLDESISPEDVEFITTTEDYDIYKYNYKNLSYIIKISLDSSCQKIQHEANNLKKINPIIRADYVGDGIAIVSDPLRYIITSYENAESISDIGVSYLLEHFDNFCYSYSLMQEPINCLPIASSYKDYLSNCFRMANIEEFFSEEAIDGIKSYTDFNLLKKIMNDMKNELALSYDPALSSTKFICHGNLNSDNIITRNEMFKFINFDSCYRSHCFLDLSEFFIEFGVPENSELKMLTVFCSYLNIDFNPDTIKFYKKCYEMTLIKKGIEIIINYLKEVYLYRSYRIDKIIEISDKFSKSYNRYMSISYFRNNRDFITKTITEPILNRKA